MPLYNPTTAAALQGTTTNDNAVAGRVGEYMSQDTLTGSAVSLTSSTAANVCSITLTPGDWDVWYDQYFNFGATTNVTQLIASISTSSATLQTGGSSYTNEVYPSAGEVPGSGSSPSISVGPRRISVNTNTTVYGVARATFTLSTAAAFGIIRARRVR